jgi:hypothetical protein
VRKKKKKNNGACPKLNGAEQAHLDSTRQSLREQLQAQGFEPMDVAQLELDNEAFATELHGQVAYLLPEILSNPNLIRSAADDKRFLRLLHIVPLEGPSAT